MKNQNEIDLLALRREDRRNDDWRRAFRGRVNGTADRDAMKISPIRAPVGLRRSLNST